MHDLSKFINRFYIFIFILAGLTITGPAPASAQEPFFIGEIRMFGGNFAPRGWALCDGHLLSISQYQALFSILGTTYGGDGRTTFALPDLRGRIPMHPGRGPGLTPRQLGEKSGAAEHQLTTAQMPSHTHAITVKGSPATGDSASPTGKTWAVTSDGSTDYADTLHPEEEVQMDSSAVRLGGTGSSSYHDNMPPFQVVNYIIALQGTFPSR